MSSGLPLAVLVCLGRGVGDTGPTIAEAEDGDDDVEEDDLLIGRDEGVYLGQACIGG